MRYYTKLIKLKELKRLSSVLDSIVLTHLSESISGVKIIRAFSKGIINFI